MATSKKKTKVSKKVTINPETGEEFISEWDSSNADGELLWLLVKQGMAGDKTGKNAAYLRENYKQFQKYTYAAVNSGLQTATKKKKRQEESRAAAASCNGKSLCV